MARASSRPAAATPADARLALAAVAMLACTAALARLPPRGLPDRAETKAEAGPARRRHRTAAAPAGPRSPAAAGAGARRAGGGCAGLSAPRAARPAARARTRSPPGRAGGMAGRRAGRAPELRPCRPVPPPSATPMARPCQPASIWCWAGRPAAAGGAAACHLAIPPGRARGALLSLRFAPCSGSTRWPARPPAWRARVPAALLHDAGATLRRYPSPLQALLAFRRGECAVAAEDGALVRRLLACRNGACSAPPRCC